AQLTAGVLLAFSARRAALLAAACLPTRSNPPPPPAGEGRGDEGPVAEAEQAGGLPGSPQGSPYADPEARTRATEPPLPLPFGEGGGAGRALGVRLPLVELLIPCRNEAASLPALFAALEALDYPRERLRLTLVDDASTDSSPMLAQAWAAARPW